MNICNLLNPASYGLEIPAEHFQGGSNALSSGRLSQERLQCHSFNLLPKTDRRDEYLRQKRRIQSEKKRQWRRKLTPEQKEKLQVLDAQRKRDQRMNQSPEQRAEARRKDAARKAASRRLVKEQIEREKAHKAISGASGFLPQMKAATDLRTSSFRSSSRGSSSHCLSLASSLRKGLGEKQHSNIFH